MSHFPKSSYSSFRSIHYGPKVQLELRVTFESFIRSDQLLSRVRLCDPMNRSTPGLPVHHQLPEFTQTYDHRVRDAIQPSHPLSSPSPLAPSPSQQKSLFQWVNSSHEVAKVLEFQHLLPLYWLYQGLWLYGSQQTLKNLKRWEYQTTLPASWEICMQVKKQQLELDME